MRHIKVELTFNEDHINRVLRNQYYGVGKAPEVKDLSEEQFAWITAEMQRTSGVFVDEIVDKDSDDWLDELMQQFE